MTTSFLCCACDAAWDDPSSPVAICAAATASLLTNDLQWMHSLFDGTPVTIRPIRPQEALERTVTMERSAESRRYRFNGSVNGSDKNRSHRVADIDQRSNIAFVAFALLDGVEREIGIACYRTSAEDFSCECTVTVTDEWQAKGVGPLLMQRLIDVARTRGVRVLTSVDANENRQMHDLARCLGFRCEVDPDDAAQVIHMLVLQEEISRDLIKEA